MNRILIEELQAGIAFALKNLYNIEIPSKEIQFQETRKEFLGDFTFVVFPLVKFSKKSPEQTGIELGVELKKLIQIESFGVVNGFLNLSFTDKSLLNQFDLALSNQNFGRLSPKGKKVMVEFSSPNTNKPLHLGHVRNNLLGYSVAEILKAAGYEVIKTCLVNDRGIHICKSMVAYQIWGNGASPLSSGLKGDHFVGKYYVLFEKELKVEIEQPLMEGISEEKARNSSKLMGLAKNMLVDWENNVPEVIQLWKKMNNWVYEGFSETYLRLGIFFDHLYFESQTYLLGKDIIELGLEKEVFFKKEDQSVWIDLTPEGLDEKLVLRADGTSVYITQDLGTAELKFKDYQMDRSIYVVGNEQDYHFKVLFLILNKLGLSWVKGLFHLSYGMVDLPSGKMKSREGTVVDADELMDQMLNTAYSKTELLGKTQELNEIEKQELNQKIGMGALKYFLLRVDPQKRMLFNPEESIDFLGNTGPFIQYSYARIQSIYRKFFNDEVLIKKISSFNNLKENKGLRTKNFVSEFFINVEERDLLKFILAYEKIVEEAADSFSPALICQYLYELAKKFNHFYHLYPVLKEENLAIFQFRLNLCKLTGEIIFKGMKLLGINVPEKM
jgi:arginyl-tRNA synthetase